MLIWTKSQSPSEEGLLFLHELTKNVSRCMMDEIRNGQESGENPEQFYPCCMSNEKSHIPLKKFSGRGFE